MSGAQIFVPSPLTFIVQVDGKQASNWRELMVEARAEVEAEYCKRWQDYQYRSAVTGIAVLAATQGDLEVLSTVETTPSMYYECSEELATKVKK